MALIAHSNENLVGGVSQQPPIKRFPTQCEVQENALGTVVEGLRKRPPTEHLGTLTSAPTGAVGYHTINRDDTERYVVAVESKALRVYDLSDGSSQTVYDINGDVAAYGAAGDFDYLETTDPEGDLEFLTIADATIVVNKAKQPLMDSATSADRGYESLVFVKQGNYSSKYILEVDSRKVTFITPDASSASDADGIQTDYIADMLKQGLTSGSVSTTQGGTISYTGSVLDLADYDIERVGSTVWIKRDNAADFDISTDDSVASSAVEVIKDSVQTFSSLPTVAPNGFTIKVNGLPEQDVAGATSYYAKFETMDTDAAAFGDGTWEESVKGGIEYKADYTTMPHLLVRLSNGDFLWTQVSGAALSGTIGTTAPYTAPKWGELEAGDQETNPRPAFLQTSAGADGEKIRGMGFYKDRLVLLSGETALLSEVGQYFNFFRTTVTTLLDSARISVVAASTRVNLLNYVAPLRGNLVLFSESSQFVLSGGGDGTLTPSNVSVDVASEFESTTTAEPQAAESSVFFVGTRGANTTVRELFDASTNRPEYDAVDITGQAPSYIVGTTTQMAVSPTEECLVLKASGDTTLYIYKWSINGRERVQSAWSKFTIGGTDAKILHIEWVDQLLYLVVRRGTQTSLERMDFEPFLADADAAFRVHLDRRITDATTGVSSSYDAGANTTTFSLPYTLGTGVTMKVVSRASGGVSAGQDFPVTASTTTSVTVAGDKTSMPVYIGEQYTMLFQFSELYMPRGNRMSPVGSISHRVRYGRISFADTAFFKVRVTPKGESASTYIWNGNLLNETETLLGSVSLYSTYYQFPVMAPHNRVTIELENDSPLPSRFIACEWEAFYHSRIPLNGRF